MSLPALFGAAGGTLSRRIFSQAPAALSRLILAGARLLIHLQSQRNLGVAAATASRRFSFFRRDHKLNAAMAIALFSAAGGGIWHMSKNLYHANKEEDDNEISMSTSKGAFSCSNEAECPNSTGEAEEVEDLRIIQFKEWMDEYGIEYPDEKTRRHRFSIFKANVELHGYNIYKEYRAALDDPCYDDMVRSFIPKYHDIVRSLRPSKIDWVEAGVVSPVVRNQYACGCCWAMAVVASVEALHYMKTKQSVMLSVQELIDCDTKNNGCVGGFSEPAFDYIKVNGLSTESSNPYMARSSVSSCKKDKTAAARVSGFRTVSATEDALEEAVAKQPVIVTLQSSSGLRSYKGGIMDYEALPQTLPDGSNTKWHNVLIVGYGTNPDGIKYWRFKNSWGEGWGEAGFARIRRHVGDERGALGMFMRPAVYPVLDI